MRYLISILTLAVAIGCSSESKKDISLQERAEALAEQYTKSVLYVPESYEPIETKIDSAFTSIYNDVEINAAASKILKYQYENRLFLYLSDLSERDSKMLLSNVDIIKKRAEEITREFCGWEIYHRCRVKDINGIPGFIMVLYCTNKDLSEVIITYDLDDNNEYNIEDYKEVIDCAIDGEYDTLFQPSPSPPFVHSFKTHTDGVEAVRIATDLQIRSI